MACAGQLGVALLDRAHPLLAVLRGTHEVLIWTFVILKGFQGVGIMRQLGLPAQQGFLFVLSGLLDLIPHAEGGWEGNKENMH